MRTNEKNEIILTRKKAAELFLILSNARYKLTGKYKTSAENFWKEFEDVLGLNPNKDYVESITKGVKIENE